MEAVFKTQQCKDKESNRSLLYTSNRAKLGGGNIWTTHPKFASKWADG